MLILFCSRISNLKCDIFRLHFDDVVANHMQSENGFPVMLSQWVKDGLVSITQTEVRFNYNNSLISLEHCNSDEVMLKHQGIGKHIRVFEEATQIKERYIRWLRGWCSMPEDMKDLLPAQIGDLFPHLTAAQIKEMFPKIIYTSNPIGVSAGYFRREFVKARKRYEIERTEDKEGGFLRQYIPAKVEDNPSENAEATRRRVSGIGDDAITDALLNENWDSPVGDFIRQWDDERNVVDDFTPPAHWFKFRGHDWGSSEPAYTAWASISDGEEFVDEYGQLRWFHAGCIVIYREWNTCREDDTSKGLELNNDVLARGIVSRTPEVTSNITVTDSLPFQTRGGELMADTYAKNGCPLTRGNTDRVTGWKQLKDYIHGVDGFPMFVVTRSCKYLIEYIPMLQRHKLKAEDAVESGEATHACDTVRLITMTRPPIRKQKQETQSIARFNPGPKVSTSPNELLKRIKRKERAGGGRR